MESISVIVPIYYGEKYMAGIIEQIEACKRYMQEPYPVELVFVNDSPESPLPAGLESEFVEIVMIDSDKNVGIHGARVKGFLQCTGDYVLFLDQDDKINPEYFCSQIHALGENDAVICQAMNEGKEVYSGNNHFDDILSREYVLKIWNPIVSPGQVLMRKAAVPMIWTEHIMQNNGADDWLLWLCMLADGWKISLNKRILYEHISQNFNTSDNVTAMLRSEQEVLRITQEQELFNDEEKRWLAQGFFRRNLARTQELYLSKKKMQMMDQWMNLREQGIRYSEYLQKSGIQTVAIYGAGMLGEHLYSELKEAVEVKCFIDRNAAGLKRLIPVYTLKETLPEFDGIIITLADGIEKVVQEIKSINNWNVFVLKNWIMGVDSR